MGKKPLLVQQPKKKEVRLYDQYTSDGAPLSISRTRASDTLCQARVSPSTFKALHATPGQLVAVATPLRATTPTATSPPPYRIASLHPSNELEAGTVQLPAAWAWLTGAGDQVLLRPAPPVEPLPALRYAVAPPHRSFPGFAAVLRQALEGKAFPAGSDPGEATLQLFGRAMKVSLSIPGKGSAPQLRGCVGWLCCGSTDIGEAAGTDADADAAGAGAGEGPRAATLLTAESDAEAAALLWHPASSPSGDDAAAAAAAASLPGTLREAVAGIRRTFPSGAAAADAAAQARRRHRQMQSLGILLHGPRGVGKTHYASRIAEATGWHVVRLSSGGGTAAATPESVAALLKEACGGGTSSTSTSTPLCVVIDELPSHLSDDATASESAFLLESALCSVLDAGGGGGGSGGGGAAATAPPLRRNVLVVGVAPSPDAVGRSLRRAGRFSVEVEVAPPASAAEREALLLALLLGQGWGEAEVAELAPAVGQAAAVTHGCVAADLLGLVAAAELRAAGEARGGGGVPKVSGAMLLEAAKGCRPASLRTHEVTVPCVRWTDVGGQAEAKQILAECVEWPLKHAVLFEKLALRPPSGVLLYGPPGCSKTLLAKALATECHYNFIAVKGPELYNKWVGESEKAVRDVFAKARAAAPTILFFDELDGMCGKRGGGGVTDRVISQFLTEMDGLPSSRGDAQSRQVVVLAATNRPDNIDAAMLRPGRIDRKVYVGLPDAATRQEICAIALRGIPIADNVCLRRLAEALDGRSGAEVVSAAKEGVMICMTRQAAAVDMRDLMRGVMKVQPRTNQDDLRFYSQWGAQR